MIVACPSLFVASSEVAVASGSLFMLRNIPAAADAGPRIVVVTLFLGPFLLELRTRLSLLIFLHSLAVDLKAFDVGREEHHVFPGDDLLTHDALTDVVVVETAAVDELV